MESKMIEFGRGTMPRGFSTHLSHCFELVNIDIYATPDYTDGTLVSFRSDGHYYLVKGNTKQFLNYRELGQYELLDGIFSKGDYFHSFYIAKNLFDKNGTKIKLIALLYEERGEIHIWNPTFEELFLPLIKDDLENSVDSHWRSLLEIHQRLSPDLDVYDIALRNQVDYEIEGINGQFMNTVVYYALLKHIFLVENEKYPFTPGSDRTLQSYTELYNQHLTNSVDMDKWRKDYHLKDYGFY